MQNQLSPAEARCTGRGAVGALRRGQAALGPGGGCGTSAEWAGHVEVRPPGPAVPESEHLVELNRRTGGGSCAKTRSKSGT